MSTTRRRVAYERVDAPPGFGYREDFLRAEDEAALLAHLRVLTLGEVRMHGVVAKRRVIHFGWDYGYESWKIEPADPFPQWLVPFRDSAGAFAGVNPVALEQVLIACYPPGAAIGWHRDAPMFGEPVIGLSLGSAVTMRLRRKTGDTFVVHEAELLPRSVYVIAGEARRVWQHMVPAAREERWSITFRTIRGRR